MNKTNQNGVIAGVELQGSPDARRAPRRRRKNRAPVILSEEQWELIEVCVRVSQIFGIPRSVGEILGFIFCVTGPVAFDDIVHGLGISNGSASHGLRFLRRLGAIKVSFYAHDRRDFFQAETALRRIVQGYLAENVVHQLSGITDRLRGLEGRIIKSADPETRSLSERVTMLLNWNHKAGSAIAAALHALH